MPEQRNDDERRRSGRWKAEYSYKMLCDNEPERRKIGENYSKDGYTCSDTANDESDTHPQRNGG
ncbi:MAG: hypothetical protein E6G94_04620 [Alphaproteobacteria bacterium]|nr:MAG: hypothetical protein E6G94_04620 [Alphaproteobacteria bacterium]